MDEATDIAARTQRFTEAARAFTLPSPSRQTKLAPFAEGIVELRQKGASLRLIRELLATVGVAVGTDTIARFLAEANREPMAQRPVRRTGRHRAAVPGTARVQPVVDTRSLEVPSPPSDPIHPLVDAPRSDPPTERSRSRGPRIADPRNL